MGHEKQMRHELATAMAQFFAELTIPKEPPPIDDRDRSRFIALASLAARCRSAVERDGRSREIELIPDHEAPGRLTLTLMRLLAGLKIIGVNHDHAWELLMKVGLDCMPKMRRNVFMYLMDNEELHLEGKEIADKLGYPTTTVSHTLEDMAAHHIIVRHAGSRGHSHSWKISDWAYKLYKQANHE